MASVSTAYIFILWSCGNELEGLALVAWGQKSLFPHWPTLHNLFAITHTGVVTVKRDILAVVYRFVTHHFYCSQHCTQERGWAQVRWMLPLVVQLGKHSEKLVASEERGKSNKGVDGKELNQSGMLSGLSLVHLHPTSVVEPGGMSMELASVRDRLSPTRKGKLWWRVCLHPHIEQGRSLQMEKKRQLWMPLFSLLQMGVSSSKATPLKYIKKKNAGTSLIPRV